MDLDVFKPTFLISIQGLSSVFSPQSSVIRTSVGGPPVRSVLFAECMEEAVRTFAVSVQSWETVWCGLPSANWSLHARDSW